jgi:hypothetical protein
MHGVIPGRRRPGDAAKSAAFLHGLR